MWCAGGANGTASGGEHLSATQFQKKTHTPKGAWVLEQKSHIVKG